MPDLVAASMQRAMHVLSTWTLPQLALSGVAGYLVLRWTLLVVSVLRARYFPTGKLATAPDVSFLFGIMPDVKNPGFIEMDILRFTESMFKNLSLRIFSQRVLIVSDAQDAHNVCRVLPKDRDAYLRVFWPFGARSMLWAEGAEWARQRRVLGVAFTTRALEHYEPIMHACIRVYLDKLDNTGGAAFDPDPMTSRLTMDVVMACILEQEFASIAPQVEQILRLTEKMFSAAQFHMRSPRVVLFGAPFLRLRAKMHNWQMRRRVKQIVQARRPQVEKQLDEDEAHGEDARRRPRNAFYLLMQAARKDPEFQVSDDDLVDITSLLMVAGNDTTAHTLSFLYWELARNPDVQAALASELDAVLTDPDNTVAPTREEIDAQLPLLQRVVKETLRLWTPAGGTLRVVPKHSDLSIKCPVAGKPGAEQDARVPGGTSIVVMAHVMHRRLAYYPDPTVWDPDRWLESSPRYRKITPEPYMPFSQGPRVCIGNRFALQEIQMTIAAVVRRFRIELAHDAVPGALITLRPRGLQVRFVPRV